MSVIKLTPDVALKLETVTAQMRGKEFSGIGFVRFEKGDFEVYEVIVISVGSEVYTEIPSQKILQLMARSDAGNMKLWFHRHGLGNGIPGDHNWSGTDTRTAREEPLGCPVGMAHLVKWSVSIVRTPNGWVGRYDTYGENGKATHLRVTPSLAQTITPELDVLRQAYDQFHGYAAHHNQMTRWKDVPYRSSLAELYEGVKDFDPETDLQDEADDFEQGLLAQIGDEVAGMTYTEARQYVEEVYGYDNPVEILAALGIKRQSTFLGRLFK
jgi:hypothetical protein